MRDYRIDPPEITTTPNQYDEGVDHTTTIGDPVSDEFKSGVTKEFHDYINMAPEGENQMAEDAKRVVKFRIFGMDDRRKLCGILADYGYRTWIENEQIHGAIFTHSGEPCVCVEVPRE